MTSSKMGLGEVWCSSRESRAAVGVILQVGMGENEVITDWYLFLYVGNYVNLGTPRQYPKVA